ncbi:N4-gp56 family major capsid protein [Planomicrobium sp. YIM 101495]|uniref:N4-gp56 family major capsid protein n=1 Tax=Planomicrobium sp. YIM 101495 TaxID=2665160 RepID=UPI0012B77AF0|nr:N4-gp56 family major capsid protein [Planomicrobium sp. YIM 101495]MTD30165.1 N4-gp56 family major capsid protein [Planomicrobium sp. YIM 101495]
MPSVTKLQNLIDPEVMAAIISAQLPKAIKFSGIAPIDNTLEGQPGSTITVPKFKYIGDAKIVAEGEPIQYEQLTTDSAKYTIQKAGIGVILTDEAVLSGYGDPVGEAQRQVRMSIASKVDNDIVDTAMTAPLSIEHEINLDLIDALEATFVDAPDNFENVDTTGVLFLSYKDAAKLRKEAMNGWTRSSELGDRILVTGAFGELFGWEIVRSQKIEDGTGFAVKAGALKTYLKRQLLPETGRDMDRKLTKFNADQHYSVALVDESRIVRIGAATTPEG